jgi:Nif-specific regulatory protein
MTLRKESQGTVSGAVDVSEASAAVSLSGLYEISRILCSPTELGAMLVQVMLTLENFLDMNACVCVLLDAEDRVERIVGSHVDPAVSRDYFFSMPERVLGHIVTHQAPLVVPDVALDQELGFRSRATWQVDPGRIGLMGVPVPGRDGVIGALILDCNAFSPDSSAVELNTRLFAMVGHLIGQTVRLHRLVERDRTRLMGELDRRNAVVADSRLADDEAETRIVGESPAILAVMEKIKIVARSNATVLLRGESGTGKEVFSRAMHNFSPRSHAPFVKLNCAALSESVLESELFGHEKGAFTGAVNARKGRFELADGGTLFLDEIGEISMAFQAKLLRVLQEGEFERVGGTRTLKVNVRIVAATNRDLEDAVTKGKFRADLYYRLSVIPVFLPPLRERPSDIPLLAKEFLERFNTENGTHLQIDAEGLAVLGGCYFPGNVRELENCIRRTATLSRGSVIGRDDFACHSEGCLSSVFWKGGGSGDVLRASLPSEQRLFSLTEAPPSVATPAEAPEASPPSSLSEKGMLEDTMEKAGWVQAKAARMLGLTPRQVGYALRKNGIPIKKF